MTTTPDTSRPVPFTGGAAASFSLCFEGMLWSRRSLFAGVLLGLPALFALFYRAARLTDAAPRLSGLDVYGLLAMQFSVANALPLAALFYASALVAEEIEGKTLVYLLSRPVTRPAMLLGKFAAYLATTITLSLPATVLSFLLLASTGGLSGLGAAAPGLLRDLGVMVLALVAYGSVFTLLGVALRRPLIPGLVFLYGWELLVYVPGELPRLTLTAWLRSLLPYRVPVEGLAELLALDLGTGTSLAVLAAVSALALGAALGLFSAREYVVEP